MDSRATERRLALSVFAILALVFVVWPEIDLAVAGRFHANEWAWLLPRESLFIVLPYQAVPFFGRLLVGLLVVMLLVTFVPRWPAMRPQRLLFAFLLSGAMLGPVLVVDAGLKNYLGRARPAQIEAFGGSQAFTPAFMPSTQCERNCSFVSGHVATAAFVMVFGWLGSPRIRRRWLLVSLAVAAYVGMIRMAVGGHFLSDCLFAWFATYFSLDLVEWLFARIAWLSRTRAAFVVAAGAAALRVGLLTPPLRRS